MPAGQVTVDLGRSEPGSGPWDCAAGIMTAMTTRQDELSEFLKSRRARLAPADVGLAAARKGRRVTGLRREELAMLAGVSLDYYARLEQGRAANVSHQVLDAVAAALV